MDSNTYQAEFGRSLAPVFFPANVNPAFVGDMLRQRVKGAELVDGVKRALFYNKTDRLPKADLLANVEEIAFNIDVDDLHAVLGMEGEMGEITEILIDPNLTEQEKIARLIDESGDFLWYLALAFMNRGISFQDVFARNIEKLKQRYPDKFTVDLAVNRDLAAEAAVFN